MTALAAARIMDMCTGHFGFNPRPAIEGSPDIFINGRSANRTYDRWATHCYKTCHDGFLSAGSSENFANGRKIGRVTDPISCGSKVATGSPDVFLG